jgi:hypothetical protein
VIAALQVALYMLLPATPATGDGRAALGAALRAPGVAGLLVGVLAFMAAFYGVFAARGTSVSKSIFSGPTLLPGSRTPS